MPASPLRPEVLVTHRRRREKWGWGVWRGRWVRLAPDVPPVPVAPGQQPGSGWVCGAPDSDQCGA